MGLGLPAAYKIVQEHKGEIKIVSEVRKGTEVTVSLAAGSMPVLSVKHVYYEDSRQLRLAGTLYSSGFLRRKGL